MALIEFDLSRVALALERIARALEGGGRRSLTGYVDQGPEASAVTYHDPEWAAQNDAERAAYEATTGIALAPWEAVPRPLDPHKKQWGESD